MENINQDTIRGLADLLVKEPSSLEVLLMLTDEGPKTIKDIKDISKEYSKITDLLDKLMKFDMITIKENIVDITAFGKCAVKKLRRYVA